MFRKTDRQWSIQTLLPRRMSQFCNPLLGRTKSRGRYWAAIRLSHLSEPSGHAVHEEVDGLDIWGQHDRGWFFCSTLAGRRGGHTSFVQAGVEASDTGAEVVKPDPRSSWEGHFRFFSRIVRHMLWRYPKQTTKSRITSFNLLVTYGYVKCTPIIWLAMFSDFHM